MKRRTIIMTIAAFLGFMLFGGQAMGQPSTSHLNWASEVNAGQCVGESGGLLVINAIHGVTNDLDSAVGGGFWAEDNYNKHIQVWKVDSTTFCAVVRYIGSFVTRAGDSPQGTGTISAGIEGTFQGGYRIMITGTLDTDPSYKMKGKIGTFDYDYRASVFDWIGAYFSDYTFDWEWWGWIYHGGQNGTWVNSDDGNQGDITD